ncbi:methylated-DNA--[protein]-cysteine S-methyltransferase [Massilicoli timonensis]|uniref:methylated-DNA--[protein]-cysteine S-methyltransferase n=1 Tax=Massilicoli timonensis TaxID=2015901 RepID=UPI000C847F5B|nr:methylated-DNA--[protein]-cysteine S-methyltransferase [Massilicoli timonensis]
MIEITYYQSPIGELLLAAKNDKLIGLWIKDQKYYLSNVQEELKERSDHALLNQTKEWLDRYFNGEKPSIKELELEPIGSEFRKRVWEILCEIPYGEVMTYHDIAKRIAKEKGIKRMSAQAVGGAVGHNPISIIIPCHRVVGSNGSLIGYAGGIQRKKYLLEHEKADMSKLFVPVKGTAI